MFGTGLLLSVCGLDIGAGAQAQRLPTGLYCRSDPSGLLMSYGQDFPAYFRRAAAYVDKI